MAILRNSFLRTEVWAEAERGAKPDDEAVGADGEVGSVPADVATAGMVVMRRSSVSKSISTSKDDEVEVDV